MLIVKHNNGSYQSYHSFLISCTSIMAIMLILSGMTKIYRINKSLAESIAVTKKHS